MAGTWVQILAMALRRVHLCHWCSCGGNWCLNRLFQRQKIEMWFEKCFMTPFWRKIYLSRLPLQESHKHVRGCKKRFRKAVRVQVLFLFCFTLYKESSHSTVSSRAGSTSLSFWITKSSVWGRNAPLPSVALALGYQHSSSKWAYFICPWGLRTDCCGLVLACDKTFSGWPGKIVIFNWNNPHKFLKKNRFRAGCKDWREDSISHSSLRGK